MGLDWAGHKGYGCMRSSSWAVWCDAQVVNSGQRLDQLLPAPGQEDNTGPLFVTRSKGCIQPDKQVLSSLLPVKPEDELELQQLRLNGLESGTGSFHRKSSANLLGVAEAASLRSAVDGIVPDFTSPTSVSRDSERAISEARSTLMSTNENSIHSPIPRTHSGPLTPSKSPSKRSTRAGTSGYVFPPRASPSGQREDENGSATRSGGGRPEPAESGKSRSFHRAGSTASNMSLGSVEPSEGPGLAEVRWGDIPAVVINNAILRQHFRKLTFAFLKPFERYFHLTHTAVLPAAMSAADRAASPRLGRQTSASAQSEGRGTPLRCDTATPSSTATFSPDRMGQAELGPYDDLSAHFIPRFSKEVRARASDNRANHITLLLAPQLLTI